MGTPESSAPEVPAESIATDSPIIPQGHEAALAVGPFGDGSDPEVHQALEAAAVLVRAGVPVFIARPARHPDGSWDPTGGVGGYLLPKEWQKTAADLAVLDRWRLGDALCAVMGHGVDLVDIDPRHGGDASLADLIAAGALPEALAVASTPSGGQHIFVRSIAARSRDNVLPGLDVKAGAPNGEGRGFAFTAPTQKVSKTTGEIAPYLWEKRLDPALDLTGPGEWPEQRLALQRLVRGVRADTGGPAPAALHGSVAAAATRIGPRSVEEQLAPARHHTGPVPAGGRDAEAISYAGYLHTRCVAEDLAQTLMTVRWSDFEQPPGDEYLLAEALAKIPRVYASRPAGTPDLAPDSDRQDRFDRGVADIVQRRRMQAEADRIIRENSEPEAGTDNPLAADLMTVDQVLTMRRPESMIEATLDRGTTGMVYAMFAMLKSFLVVDWLLCVAAGIPWHGRRCTQGNVLYIAAEGAWGQGERLRAWQTEHGPVPAGRFHMLRRAVNLVDFHQVSCLIALIVKMEIDFLVIDTMAKSAPGVDENSATEMGVVVAALERLRDATPRREGVVLIVHHARKSGGDDGRPVARGSVAVESGIDTVYAIAKSSDGGVVVERTKRKDGPKDDRFAIIPRPVGDSLVLDYMSTDMSDLIAAPRMTPQQEKKTASREAILTAIRQHQHVPDQAVDIVLIQRITGMARTTALGHLGDLVAWGQVERTPDGKAYTYRIAGQAA